MPTIMVRWLPRVSGKELSAVGPLVLVSIISMVLGMSRPRARDPISQPLSVPRSEATPRASLKPIPKLLPVLLPRLTGAEMAAGFMSPVAPPPCRFSGQLNEGPAEAPTWEEAEGAPAGMRTTSWEEE